MADKEISIKVITETDVNQLNDLNTLLDDTKNKADESGEALKTAFEEATQQLEETNNRVEELTDELAQIELGELEGDFEEVARQLEEAEQEAEQLQDALNSIDGSTLSDASASAEELTGNLGGAGESADNLSDSMSLIEGTMLMDVGNQIGTLSSGMEGFAQDMDNASITVGQLAKNVGMAEPQMVSLINYISNATFPNEEAMAYVNALNQMGVSSNNLGTSATNMDKINDAFHLGYQNVMQLTRGLNAVGVDANNLETSFNALAYAQTNVNGGVSTLNTVLGRQGAKFQELGLNIDQVAVIMGSASQKWTTARSLNSGLSKALKECNGDLRQLERSLGLQSGALDNASQITGQYEGQLQSLADEEMEHKTLLERIGAVTEDLTLSISGSLSPFASFLGMLGSLGQTMVYANATKELAISFGILKTTEEGATVAQWGLNMSMLANPVLWLVIAIVALIAILIYLYYTNEDVRNAINGVGQFFLWLGGIIYNSIIGTIQWLATVFQNFTNQIGLNTNDWKQAVLGFILFIPQLPLQLGIALTNAIAKLLGFKGNFTNYLVQAGTNAVNNFISYVSQLPSRLWTELNNTLNKVDEWARTLPQKFWDAGVNAVKNFLNALGIHSPGIIQTSLINELVTTGNRIPYESKTLLDNIETLGEDIVTSFGNPTFKTPNFDFNNSSFGNNEISDIIDRGISPQTNNFYFTDTVVDNEDRMERIVEYVAKSINWDNTTAGRNV